MHVTVWDRYLGDHIDRGRWMTRLDTTERAIKLFADSLKVDEGEGWPADIYRDAASRKLAELEEERAHILSIAPDEWRKARDRFRSDSGVSE